MVKSIKILEEEIEKIKERNRRVELDKQWEVSNTRKILIAILTYFVMVIFFYFAKLPNPLINSIVPALAFFISTLSIPLIKKLWIKNKNERH